MRKTSKSSSPTVRKPRAVRTNPTTEEIALRAYQIYLERGGTPEMRLRTGRAPSASFKKNPASLAAGPRPNRSPLKLAGLQVPAGLP